MTDTRREETKLLLQRLAWHTGAAGWHDAEEYLQSDFILNDTIKFLSTLTPAPEAGWRDMDVSILTMRLSGNRKEYWVRITCNGRTFHVRNYSGEYLNRAEYERDTLRHILLGEPEPNLMDEKYADPAPGEPATEQPSVKEDNEALIDEIEEIISETHDIDVTDRNYAENIVGWLRLHHPAALRALEGGE